jgi:hypothetical protein
VSIDIHPRCVGSNDKARLRRRTSPSLRVGTVVSFQSVRPSGEEGVTYEVISPSPSRSLVNTLESELSRIPPSLRSFSSCMNYLTATPQWLLTLFTAE